MDHSAITVGTRVLRPEVVQAHYARDEQGYWRVERYHDGHAARQYLPRPPAGVTCYASDDDYLSWHAFTVPGRSSAAGLVCMLLAVLAAPAAWIALSGSVPSVRLMAGAVLAAGLLAQAWVEQLAVRDPAALRRLVWFSITYFALTHHRHHRHR